MTEDELNKNKVCNIRTGLFLMGFWEQACAVELQEKNKLFLQELHVP